MKNKILIVNPGSASKKYSFYVGGAEVLKGHFEAENCGYIATWHHNGADEKENIDDHNFKKSSLLLLAKLKQIKAIESDSDIELIGFRTVAPGKYFLETRLIDDEFLRQLSLAEDRAPLHVSALSVELREFMITLPNVKKYAVSDSSFFAKRFEPSKYYGLPYEVADELEIFRFGYHGISAASIVRRAHEFLGKLPDRIILCHLGSGVSVIGIKEGKGIDASMGFTPLEGTLMSTRVGNVDAGAVVHLMKNKGFSPDELNHFLNKKCGLLGLSEISDDMRVLLQKESEGDFGAKRAIDAFTYQIKKQIGSIVFAMGGVDALIFTATMGERSNFVRDRVCRGLEDLGIILDNSKNDDMVAQDGIISRNDSGVMVATIKTDEMREIFEEIKGF